MKRVKPVQVLLADDEQSFRDAFMQRHRNNGFTIRETQDVYQIPELLRTMTSLPDLVVMDLYRTSANPSTSEAEEANAEVDHWLQKLDEVTHELRNVVKRVKEPAAIRVLHEIRTCPGCEHLPVLIYTRQGLTLLSDDEIRDAIHLEAEWMLKGRSSEIEAAQMRSFLWQARQRRRRLQRDVILTLIGIVVGAASSFLFEWLM